MPSYLNEQLTYSQANIVTENAEDGKSLCLKGICIQGNVRNANQRIYPIAEINKAVSNINEQVEKNISVLGELDHPENLTINLDRVSHMITRMWMEGADGYGKLKLLSTPLGNLARTLLESGVKLGVSSRGSGNVNEATGYVSDFEIITVDIVAQPSAPGAYPKAIYEGLMNFNGGANMLEAARYAHEDKATQRYIAKQIAGFIKDLKL